MSRLVPRSEWKPRAKLGPALPRTPDEVWLHHTVTRATANPIADVRAVESVGIARFGRMSYSYLYHPPTRTWYEGAGQTVGAHTGGRNSRALGLAIIGNTDNDPMPHLVEDAAWLIRHLIDTGKLAPVARSNAAAPGPWGGGYPTGGHRDQKPTACPGRNAYALIGQIRAAVKGAATRPTLPAPPTGALTMSEAAAIRAEMAAERDRQKAYHEIQTRWTVDQIDAAIKARLGIVIAWAKIRLDATDEDVADLQAQIDAIEVPVAPMPAER